MRTHTGWMAPGLALDTGYLVCRCLFQIVDFKAVFSGTIHCGCLLQQLQDQTVSGKELLDAVGDDFRAKINGTDTWGQLHTGQAVIHSNTDFVILCCLHVLPNQTRDKLIPPRSASHVLPGWTSNASGQQLSFTSPSQNCIEPHQWCNLAQNTCRRQV